jgi:hypothetical protein
MAAATMLWARADDVLLYFFALIFGGFYGGFVAMLPAFTVDNFGRCCAPGIIGLVYTSRAFAGLVGPPVVAAVAAISGGFGMPLVATATVAGVGCFLLTRVRPIENELRNWSFISLTGSQKNDRAEEDARYYGAKDQNRISPPQAAALSAPLR